MSDDTPQGLARGLTQYGDPGFALFLRRSFARSMGYSTALLGQPTIGIASAASDLNNCHRHFPELIDAVKRGVLAAGGLPLDFPTISLGEVFLHPTSLMYRNLMAMDVEEMCRAQPLDAVVLVGGCDKTVPAQLMGAASAGVPAIALVAGPMLTARHGGERLGACTDCRRFWAKFRSGEIDRAGARSCRSAACDDRWHLRSHGHREHHGVHRRGARHAPARDRRDTRGSRRSPARGGGDRPRRGRARALPDDDRSHHHASGGRERAARAACGRWLDQRHHPPHRNCRQARHQGFPRTAKRALRHDAGVSRLEADRGALHGGLLRRGRHERGAARIEAVARPRLCSTSPGNA